MVFRKPAPADALAIKKLAPAALATLSGPWQVAFEPGRGAPDGVVLPALQPLQTSADPGVKYFSGIATYARTFRLPKGVRPGQPLWLDLGAVGDLAQVRVNGIDVGTAWHAPYRLDIAAAVRPGTNQLAIRVANTWVNRLVGDAQAAQPPGAKPVTWTAAPTYRADAPLRPAGLIGPVQLLGAANPAIKPR